MSAGRTSERSSSYDGTRASSVIQRSSPCSTPGEAMVLASTLVDLPQPNHAGASVDIGVESLTGERRSQAEALGPFLTFSSPLSAVMLMVASHDQTCPRKEL